MKEKEKRYEQWKEWECRYWLETMESCRKCLFETLCHLEKWKDIHEADNNS